MKKYFLSLFIFSFIILSCQSLSGQEVEVNWFIGSMDNDGLEDLSFKLLQAIDQGKINAYGNDDKLMTKEYLTNKLKPPLEVPRLSKEDMAIAIMSGDFSVMRDIESKHSAEELSEMANQGKNIESLFEVKKFKPFEIYWLDIEINERLKINQASDRQKGAFQYINLIMDETYPPLKEKSELCKIKFEDFIKLKLKKEQKIIEERKFMISSFDSDIQIKDSNNQVFYLSDLRDPEKRTIQELKVDNSIFRFFKGSILFFDPEVKSK